jgi:hypothetical protein
MPRTRTPSLKTILRPPGNGGAGIRQHLWAAVLCALILAWRLFQIRDLALPAWVDSVHHTLLVRILLEQGRVPTNWGPYLPQVPFYYHFGFHLSAAVFAGLSGLNLGQAMLLVGQAWQAVLALGVYALGWTLWQERQKALIAMLLVGFVSQMPAYYVTWGRYTLLAGLALMTLAMTAALSGRRVSLALLVAATAITHHYALFLLALFLALLLLTAVENRRQVLVGGLGGALLASPWLWRVLTRGQRLVRLETGEGSLDYQADYLWYLMGPRRNYVLLALALMGVVILLSRLLRDPAPGRAGGFALLGWSFTLMGLMGPYHVGPFRPDHAAIVLFLPVVLLATETLWRLQWPVAIWGLALILALWGAWETKDIVNPNTVLAGGDDVTALEWLDDELPPEAVFLIDVTPWLGSWRGVDGGWWIMPLTGRQTVLPPVVYGWGKLDVIEPINALARRTHALAQTSEGAEYCQELLRLMQEANATHYYTRSQRPEACPEVQPVYRGQDGPTIYQRSEP